MGENVLSFGYLLHVIVFIFPHSGTFKIFCKGSFYQIWKGRVVEKVFTALNESKSFVLYDQDHEQITAK